MQRRRVLFFVFALLMTACSSSNKTSASASSSGSVSGNWQMSLQKADNTTLAPKTQSGFLLQSNNLVTGSMLVTNNPCSGVGNVTGTVTGADILLIVNPLGTEINLTGTLGTGNASMSGNYTILSNGCGGSQTAPQTGTWTADLVAPLNGNIQGTFSSTHLATSYAVTGQISQAPNTGVSNASLSGSLSITGYCFTTATISGAVSGTSVVLNLLDSNGAQIGQVTGTSSLDGSALTGTYNIIPVSGQSAPCNGGDSGPVTLTL